MYVLSGVNKFVFFSHRLEKVEAKKLPFPRLSLSCTIVVQVVCGLAIISGCQTVIASQLLAILILATAVVSYDFWNQQGTQRILFLPGVLEHISIMVDSSS
ncbi:DoxX family protein [Paraburkholderia sediminicola]|uniref:DoxX family protein n=1 Tax=Paraburkholderia sediminicola TaxID=458836 RepID=UPI0038B7EBD2